jgi:hypothetical protein
MTNTTSAINSRHEKPGGRDFAASFFPMAKEIAQLAYRELLSDADLAAILDLRQTMTLRYQRCKRLDHFRESLVVLCSFVEQHRDDDWKRALVTGICPCGSILAVNNTRLQEFTNRSKSSINDLFSKLRYQPIAINQRNQFWLINKIPFLKLHNDELRQWTFRSEGCAAEVTLPSECPTEMECPANVLPPIDTTVDCAKKNAEGQLKSDPSWEDWESLEWDEHFFAS